MTSRSIFHLKIWYSSEDSSCSFLLLWDGGKKNIYITHKYSQELQLHYQRWRQQYYKFYQFPSSEPVKKSGGISLIGAGDPSQALREAEQELLKVFQRWLGTGDVRQIEKQIGDELTRITQNLSQSKEGEIHNGIDIYLACNDELLRLPWEAWKQWLIPQGIDKDAIRILRTSINDIKGITHSTKKPQHRKTRILAIMGYDPRLPLKEDWKTLRSLKSIAEVQRVEWKLEDSDEDKRNKVLQAIVDQRGWDILFFAGHSEETNATGGTFVLTDTLSLSINDIEEHLQQARENGLQLAIFNSCSGLSIANSLLELGLQVIVMREPIRNDVAQSFLQQFCQQLIKSREIYDALFTARQYLQSIDKFAFPSAYLIPSYFIPPNVAPYRIESFGWKKILYQWLPTKRESMAVGILLLLSLMVPVQDFLLEWRHLFQSINRQVIYRILLDKDNNPIKNEVPSVLLIEIDQNSINDIRLRKWERDPIDRGYLAELVEKISEFNAKVVGIEYILGDQAPRQEKLAQALQESVKNNNTWFVFAKEKKSVLNPDLVGDKRWNFTGHNSFHFWNLKFPDDRTCLGEDSCSFSYLLALSFILEEQNQNQFGANIPKPDLGSSQILREKTSNFLKNHRHIKLKKNIHNFIGIRSIIDFSLPPQRIYQTISAKKFLNQPLSNKNIRTNIRKQIVIIAPGEYDRIFQADDSAPLAFEYWCNFGDRENQEKKTKDCSERITAGESHAYRVHHLLSQHYIIQIPDICMIFIAIIIGKWSNLNLQQQKLKQRRKTSLILAWITFGYFVAGLQVYIFVSVAIPLFLPSLTFWFYILSTLRRKSYG
ncbi:MAG: CHASE2 domain-containing protein [Cyanobacteria bacterium P01_D01_bin.50]